MSNERDELYERLRNLPASCRPTDAAVYNHLVDDGGRIAFKVDNWAVEPGSRLSRYHDGWLCGNDKTDKYSGDLPRYTSSLDATVKLVESIDRAYCYRVEKSTPSAIASFGGPYWATCGLPGQQEQGVGQTPAIALLVALFEYLRARAPLTHRERE